MVIWVIKMTKMNSVYSIWSHTERHLCVHTSIYVCVCVTIIIREKVIKNLS